MSLKDFDPFAGGELLRVSPTTAPQREVFASTLMGDDANVAFNEAVSLQIEGPLDPDRLALSLSALVRRHDILRATFTRSGAEICLQARDSVALEIISGEDTQESAREEFIRKLWQQAVAKPMNLLDGPLFFAWLLRFDDEHHELVLALHHIICDGWSFGLLLKELAGIYRNGGIASGLPPAPSFLDFAERQDANQFANSDIDFWYERFATVPPVLDLPLDHPRPPARTFNAARLDFDLGTDLVTRLPKVAGSLRTSLVNTVLAAYFALLYRLSGTEDLVVGLPVAGQGVFKQPNLVGHLVQLLPIRITLSGEDSFADLVARVKAAVLTATEHPDFTFGSLLERLKVDRSRVPLVATIFNIDQQLGELDFGAAKASVRTVPRCGENFELFLNVLPSKERLTIEATYSTALFSEATLRSWLGAMEQVLRDIADDSTKKLSQLQLANDVPPALEAANRTITEARHVDLLASFHEQVISHPEREAVCSSGTLTTYNELMAHALRFSALLASHGVKEGDRVGVCCQRSEDMIAAVLGILTLGAAFVPLDNEFPPQRLLYMLEDSGAVAVIEDSSAPEQVQAFNLAHVTVESARLSGLKSSAAMPGLAPNPERLAYLIYTSGTTGKPKGVAVSHGAVINFLESMAQRPGFGPEDRLLAVTTLSFDISILELFLPLIVGGTTIVAEPEAIRDAEKLATLIRQSRATVMQATPATWRLLLTSSWPQQMREGGHRIKALCGGEQLPADLAAGLLPLVAQLWNMYGPTETTVWSTCKQITTADAPITVGLPIANTRVFVLDAWLQPLPVAVPGELCIAGAGLAREYHNLPELTAERLVNHPRFGRLYRTGDLAKIRPDGEIEHLGRLDNQVKVRGYRIELGEIETVMRQQPGVQDAAVDVREMNARDSTSAQTSDIRLIGFVQWQGPALSLQTLRERLQAALPTYMIPQLLQSVQTLPRTLNGKLDRRALHSVPLDADTVTADRKQQPPETPTEMRLLPHWQAVLNTSNHDIDTSFFDLGGHSLLAAQLLLRIETEFDRRLEFRAVFKSPTLRQLALLLDDSNGTAIEVLAEAAITRDTMPITARSDSTAPPLSLAQQRVWYLHKLDPKATAYNLPSAFHLRGDLNLIALETSLSDLIQRQDSLRTCVADHDGMPTQKIVSWDELFPSGFKLELKDISHLPDKKGHLQQCFVDAQKECFDLYKAPLWQVALYRLDAQDHVLFFMPHHLVFDGWSFDIFVHELVTGYEARCSQTAAKLPELAFQYTDYALWQRQWLESGELQSQLGYWQQQLNGVLPTLEMPFDFPREPTGNTAGDQVFFELENRLTQRLSHAAVKQGCSLFMVILAAYAVLLNRYTRQDELLIGAPMADRSRPGTGELIGFFVNALALRIQIDPGADFLSLLKDVREKCLGAFSNQDTPFEKLLENVKVERDLSQSPVFQTSLTYQDVSRRESSMAALDIQQIEVPAVDSLLDISAWLKRRGDRITGAFVYKTTLFERETVEQLVRHFVHLLESISVAIEAADKLPVSKLAIYGPSERQLLLAMGQGETCQWQHSTLLDLITPPQEHAADAVAVICGETTLSREALETRSNQLAHRLIAVGVEPGNLVGVCVQRSVDLPVVLLGILKAGGAYVPLDPEYPADRLAYMAQDAALRFLVTSGTRQDQRPHVTHCLVLEDLAIALAAMPQTRPEIRVLDASSPAYVIYTSGSTGKPKGVCVSHGSVVNFLSSMARRPGLEADDCLLAVTTLSFDIAVLELMLPLVTGARLIIASPQDVVDARRLQELLVKHAVTCMQATPATWRLLLGSSWQGRFPAKVLCGGEALAPDLADALLGTGVELWNMYGPTETTVWSSCGPVQRCAVTLSPGKDRAMPISLGEAIANTQLLVLDAVDAPVPHGVAGELCIGGSGVALGYLNRDELTSARFVANPCGSGRIYRTGDLVRYRRDGSLEYFGRLDNQVKVRGYRIELEEIESCLRAHPQVKDCALSVREERAGDARLVLFVVWESQALTLTDVRRFLQAQLPLYMIPQHIETLHELPRTLNGKLDRKALQAYSLGVKAASRQQAKPKGEREQWLAQLWQEVCSVDAVGRFDNFFEIGGHSLLSMQVINRIGAAGRGNISPRDMLMENLATIAEKLAGAAADAAQQTKDEAPGKAGIRGILGSFFERE